MNDLYKLTILELKEIKSGLNELLKGRYGYTSNSKKENALNRAYISVDIKLIKLISEIIIKKEQENENE